MRANPYIPNNSLGTNYEYVSTLDSNIKILQKNKLLKFYFHREFIKA